MIAPAPMNIQYTFQCSQCASIAVCRWKSLAGQEIPKPSIPPGWKTYSDDKTHIRLLCPSHTITIEIRNREV